MSCSVTKPPRRQSRGVSAEHPATRSSHGAAPAEERAQTRGRMSEPCLGVLQSRGSPHTLAPLPCSDSHAVSFSLSRRQHAVSPQSPRTKHAQALRCLYCCLLCHPYFSTGGSGHVAPRPPRSVNRGPGLPRAATPALHPGSSMNPFSLQAPKTSRSPRCHHGMLHVCSGSLQARGSHGTRELCQATRCPERGGTVELQRTARQQVPALGHLFALQSCPGTQGVQGGAACPPPIPGHAPPPPWDNHPVPCPARHEVFVAWPAEPP